MKLRMLAFGWLCLTCFGTIFGQENANPNKEAAKAQLQIGLQKLQNAEYADAIAFFNKAIELDDKYIDAYLERAFCNGASGNYQAAIDDYDKIIKLKPELDAAYLSRGSSKLKLKRYREAILDFDHVIQVNPNNYEAYNNRGWAKKGLGDDKGACQDWQYSKKKGNDEARIILQNNHCR